MTLFFLISPTTMTHLPRVKSYDQAAQLYASIFDVRDMTNTSMYAFEPDGDTESSEPIWKIIDAHCNWHREESPLACFGIGLTKGISQKRLDNALERIEELESAIEGFTSDYDDEVRKVQRAIEDLPSTDSLPTDTYSDDEDA